MQLCTYAIRWYTYVIWSNGIRIIDWSWDGVAQSQTTLDNTRQPLPRTSQAYVRSAVFSLQQEPLGVKKTGQLKGDST